ncbi:class I/II aminotransferase [Actinoplanes friuliensis DSM 7358]|uniref:histidinol-phosphate transaminase n=1 Tax=Actinoplanes friuliensis DSM 7358 TaxID=1246995 RepID=U5VWA2_9ACTN|nr:class I/II aminotransferase [Actinoplanes friuliensis DSM 7358]
MRGVPYNDDLTFPYERFERALERTPKLIVLINPNNPTGTHIDLAFIEQVVRTHPDVPVIVDEAYFEFTGRTVAPLTAKYDNLLVIRTFSKAFAMAGMRLGYVVAHPGVITQLAKMRNPFDVNSLAMVAAKAQLAHVDEIRAYVDEVMLAIKPSAVNFFSERGVAFWPGAANFVLVRPSNCQAVVVELKAAGILVRPITATPLAGTFRMSMGTQEEMTRVFDVLDGLSFLRKAEA